MIGKIFSVNTDIVYRREESLNLFEGKKKLDKVVSGRVFKEQIKLLGLPSGQSILSDLLSTSQYE